MIIDGKTIASDIVRAVREELSSLGLSPRVRAITVAPSPATDSYLSIKERRAMDAGMTLEVVRLPDNVTDEEVIREITKPGADSVIVQLPLPAHLNRTLILNAIPLEQDADVLSLKAYEAFEANAPGALLPPVVGAVKEILERENISLAGKQVTVIGQGRLVGEPCATWLAANGAYPVHLVTKEEGDYSSLKEADLVVSGAGSSGLIKPEHLKPGVVLIDAGTSESDGAIVGDADPGCSEVASVFTPVPGGVGPIAVACLFRNAGILAQKGALHTGL